MAVIKPMPKRPTPLAMAPPLPRLPVGLVLGRGVLVSDVKVELLEMSEPDGVGDDTELVVVVVNTGLVVVVVNTGLVVVVVVESEDGIEEPPEVEIGGEVDVTPEGRLEIEVVLLKQSLDEPGLTVMTGVSLLSTLESLRTITTLVPAGIVTISQVNEVPEILVKVTRTGPSALPVWKVRLNGGCPVMVS